MTFTGYRTETAAMETVSKLERQEEWSGAAWEVIRRVYHLDREEPVASGTLAGALQAPGFGGES